MDKRKPDESQEISEQSVNLNGHPNLLLTIQFFRMTLADSVFNHWFSNLSVYESHEEGLWKHRSPQLVWGEAKNLHF